MIKFRKNSLTKIATWSIVFISAGIITHCSSTKKSSPTVINDVIKTNIDAMGTRLEIRFIKGNDHNHPLMAIWLEDSLGRYIETIFVAESIGKGIFQHVINTGGHWYSGPLRRPAALPYWGHKRGVKADDGYYIPTPENPMPDAVTGPTPTGDFVLQSKSAKPVPSTFKILMEINQSWDWNEFWTNDKYPGDENYQTSSQPAVVYEALVNLKETPAEYTLKPVGHSHYSGLNGSLNPDLSTLTTALGIVESVSVKVTE
jgi:hypothetical protein